MQSADTKDVKGALQTAERADKAQEKLTELTKTPSAKGSAAANQAAVAAEVQELAKDVTAEKGYLEKLKRDAEAQVAAGNGATGSTGAPGSPGSGNTFYEQWLRTKGFPAWEAEPAVFRAEGGRQGQLRGMTPGQARGAMEKLFRFMMDNYDNGAGANLVRTEWIKVTGQKELWKGGPKKRFLELYDAGRAAWEADHSPPLPSDKTAAMTYALQQILKYQRGKQGDRRWAGTVKILGQAQNTKGPEHLATVAWYAAYFIVQDAGNTKAIYLDRDLNGILKELGIPVQGKISGDGSKPDIVRVRPDNKLDIIEVRSSSQKAADMQAKIDNQNEFFDRPANAGILASTKKKEGEQNRASLMTNTM